MNEPNGGQESTAPDPPRRAERIVDFQLASIVDVQGSITANDSKASAALIVHGLLFGGLVELVTHLGGIYNRAAVGERVLGLFLLGFALLTFVLSIWFILKALLPSHPAKKIEAELEGFSNSGGGYRRAFFPVDLLARDCTEPYGRLCRRLDTLGDDDVVFELAAERLKLADILRQESSQTMWGYWFLLAEVIAVVLFLVFLAAVVL